MQSVMQYINETYANPKFSEVYYMPSATGVIAKNFNQEGAKAIFYHNLYWQAPQVGAVLTWLDQFNLPIFSQRSIASSTAYAPLYIVKDGSQLRISCSVNTIAFHITFQYIL